MAGFFFVKMKLDSPCKVNLFLNVLRKRDDGFHDLESVFLKVPVHDQIEMQFDDGEGGFSFTCSDSSIPADESNLVVKAAQLFFQECDRTPDGRIHLTKNLPSEAGLGGGSANAAVTLLGLNDYFNRPLGNQDLHRLAAKLGSDVPFFLMRNQALGTGRGEILTDLNDFPILKNCWMVLAKPGFGVPTGWAFKSLAECREESTRPEGSAQSLAESLNHASSGWPDSNAFFNSFEVPVFRKFPLLEWLRDCYRNYHARVALLSGSGSAVFGVFENESDADDALNEIRKHNPNGMWSTKVPLS